MVAVLAAFNSIVLYRFIKKYVPLKYYWVAIFIYAFQPYTMLVLSSAMRQAVAVSFFLIAIDFIVQKKAVKYILTILFATLFHTSAVFLFPFIFLAYINWRLKLKYIIIIVLLFMVPIIYVNELVEYINLFTNLYLGFYSGYLEKSEVNTTVGLGFFLNVFIYLIVIYKAQHEEGFGNNILFKIATISLLMIPLSFGVQLIGRLNFYLLPVMMAVFPLTFEKFKSNHIRLVFMAIIILFTLYNFFIFFQSEVWKDNFGIYHTIFSKLLNV